MPTTAAQGDALIASTNAGTTTVDAARIGAGLTDAQVNDNLTIDGGTIDATPIGATTPSTGAFTTITGTTLPAASTSTDVVTSNGGALETRTAASLAGEIGVVTDATLTGDGTTGDPLGLDLANANTWTGTQTLPVTAAQGDALIASTNAGTTTVDAARIGAGLTDAQVNDNLTIDGGTVDATPIGATTPSTGAFTTITGTTLPAASTSTDVVTSNGGALETRTAASLAGEIGVVTDATLTGDGTTGDPLGIDLANANTWTGTQTLPVTAAQGDALIASTNAGTTTVDAARIGAGLTDAQVNDNLTIDGGTVDATPIGATTPSTGAFTTLTGTTITGTALPAASTSTDVIVSNGGALETRTAASLAGEIGVVTDATLTGDGTTGDPLGVDLANANTWTGTQTLPVTAAQGDALIASTNAGTTTVDAARIGAGLTDAQVNDNLTIDGGTVDATPIGATTPSTGAFTTLTGTTITGTALPAASTSTDVVTSNGGALETRTAASLAGEIGVVTDATLTGDGTTGDPLGIDLTNANTWTGTQTLPVTAAQGDALIASTNAGTTTVDAARIGAGLTDAQVNDNLTIDGGTVDATPIGGTTPSTGAFTTLTGTTITGTALPAASTSTDVIVSNGGALETRTAASLAGEIGVVTDATLTGDGTTGDPLGVDLANANTWTGTQTLPVTAAQGDALIASTNAGTTTVDAARIGAGLTDAQVNDNLTIDGGTVDATPIGATTPSTGAFTTITGTTLPAASTSTDVVTSNGGALETRTAASLAGEIGVVTDATLTGDGTTGDPLGVDLANANTWTGTQTLPVTAAQGDALIASTNAGTTTVDAARIGAGLTDAQVNDNLTIDGGTVDATPIGATTPSTGAFTTLTGTTITGTALPAASTSTDVVTSNGGALETRTAASLAGEIGVVTDATLTGDGTTGDPLGIDLANANTWTGTQTLPVTAAQGDALIASTNAGTTTVDAARIGAGLTDAQVNDNLTIDGGTVDATPIGGTTPSTGAFTTITGTTLPAASTSTDIVTSNGGALETRTLASLAGEIGVSTDATLTGDGTTGDPLGIDLTNANTWTGTQTLPTTAAQGDALIASTNAGTTTVDAARIGAGLTDAQVNDNLTINGGTVDATPIGATTPSTGAFTTITGTTLPAASTSTDIVTSNGGALETRTLASLAGEIGVSTDATLTGDGTTGDPLGIDLANANTWTGTQTLPVTAAQGDALIASTNAGTTTVDAARIGAGLTDAQVNDNLTIDGGTVDATPVGATTPSTGAFTTITGTTLPAASTSTDIVTSNGGALETRTLASLAGEIGVSTDATLTGDGTTGDPLGIDLTNANTWTGTQTLPTTAAQGDALIASTNAGTTTVDAARIGAGLTDAQVNDNLTIDGGTVDATPVGATTPSTGAFTTITGTTLPAASTSTDIVTSNGGALETRTLASLAGEIAVSTDATLTGDGTTGDPLGIDLTNANTWTGTQTLPVTAAQGDALIASTNAGTTTVDAARIGAGLTDAQVNDNLTINGGTVDATPVGATTPSTGAFTTITGTALPAASTSTDIVTSNGGTLETRTLASLAGEIGVIADATLTGDGTTGSPLGLNLANANTWTGTQTLPTTAAQGDALIASTNAGTTTVDAARIGAGLTDAQVNDNLTIDGGTVDATPIGGTTPSTGAFTTITGTTLPAASTSTDIVTSNGGALETRTLASLAGEIGVVTDATLTGDGTTGDPLGIDLTNANTWTGTQTLPTTAAQGDALIASTNAGTTTVDAARIGAGLTDAQVNDNLTINGGTVDATPVGATTPSTGVFTTLTATSTSDLQGAISNSTGNLAINDEVDVTGSIVPTADDTYNLGSSTNRWAEVFVNGATVHIGSDADEAEVRFNAGTGLEIDGDDNGTADLTIDGTTGNVGIAGDLTVSGTFTSAGFTFSPTEIDMNGGDIVDVDDLQFSQATSDISNTAADVVVDDNLNVTGNTDLDGTLNVNGITTLGDGDDNVTVNVGTGDLALAGIDAGAAADELLTINTGTNVVGRRAFATAVDQGITHDAVNGEFVLGADASGTNPITTGRFVTVNNQLTFDGSGMIDFQAPTLRLGETGTTALSIGNSGTAHTIAGNNMTGTFGGQVALTSEADISINHSLTGGGITTQATSAVSSSGATMNATYTSAGVSDLSELLLDATTVSAVSYNDDGVGNLTNYFELTADHSAQTLLVTLIDDINTPGNVIEVSADNPSNTLTMTTTDQTGSASVSLVGTSGSEAVTISAGTGSLAVEPTQTTVTGDLSVPAGNVSVTGDVAVTGSTTISNAGGVGLEVTSGGVLLSYSSGAPATIPDDVAVFEVDDATGASAPTVALPAGGANGQILYIYVSDPDGATVGGNAQAAGDKLTYIYAGGAWQLFHVN